MQNIKVIVVPENPEFIKDTTFHQSIYINSKLGEPKLKERNAKYIAPFWLKVNQQGADRLYHILGHYLSKDKLCYIIDLGNSFVLPKIWTGMANHRKFEYHDLASFGFVEIKDGLLLQVSSS